MSQPNTESINELVRRLTNHFTRIVPTKELKEHPALYWGGNGLGDRWAKKKFNYSVIYFNKEPKLYSENEDDTIPAKILNHFLQINNGTGIIGIFVHSPRINKVQRPINTTIRKQIISLSCVVCGTSDTVCDHKNDLYNDERVLCLETQLFSDFQPLCNHCNLQKRQICKSEEQNKKLFSAKNIKSYESFLCDFPWEKKAYDKTDINCKKGTYWFDLVEFNNNIYCYLHYVIPIINEIKYKIKTNKLKLIE